MNEGIITSISSIPNLTIMLLCASAIGYIGYWLVYNMYRFDTKGQVYRINVFMLPSLIIMYDGFNIERVFWSFIVTTIVAWLWKMVGKYVARHLTKVFGGTTYYDGISAHSDLSTFISNTKFVNLMVFFNEQGETGEKQLTIDGVNSYYFQPQPDSDFKIDEQGNVIVTEKGKPYVYIINGKKYINEKGKNITYIPASNIKYISIKETNPQT
ncbi:MAG: hypothetical protein FWE18_06645 [Alphaproteobacteria bacterium]|nr:hypothetical protein [Alphaproteobacteria bacterium]